MRSGIIASSYQRSEPFVIQAIGITGEYSVQLRFLGTVKVDWGDGTSSKITSNSSSLTRTFTHSYTGTFVGNIRVIGPNSQIFYFIAVSGQSTSFVTIAYSEFNKFKNLQYVYASRVNYTLSGDSEDMILPNLQEWYGIINVVNPLNTSLQILDVSTGSNLEQLADDFVNLETLIIRGTYLGTHIPATFTKLTIINILSNNTLSEIPFLPNLERLDVRGQNTISTLPSESESPKMKSILLTGQNTVTSVPAYPDLEDLSLASVNNIISSLPDYPKLITLSLREYTGNSLPNCPLLNTLTLTKSSLTSLPALANLNGSLTIANNTGLVWDIATFQGQTRLISVTNTGGNVTYSGGKTWNNLQRSINIYANLSSADVDRLIIDVSTLTWAVEKQLILLGEAQPRTSASDAAVTLLQSKGVTVLTN